MRRGLILMLAVWGSAAGVLADGVETFDNETAPSGTYADGSFTGSAGIVWTYIHGRDATADAGAYAINGSGLMLRNLTSKLYSASISAGVHDFSVNLRKAFTGAGNRQVELYINGISKGASVAFTDTVVHAFAVNGIDVAGNVTIEVRNVTSSQVVLDDLAWTSLGAGDNPNIQFTSPLHFGEIAPGSISTQFLPIINSGTSLTLNVTGLSAQSGDTNRFSSPTVFPLNVPPNGATGILQLVYAPGPVTGTAHAAVFHVLSNDPSDAAKPLSLDGSTTPAVYTVSNIQYSASNTNSPYVGQSVPLKGVCTYIDSRGYILSDDQGGPWSGVYIDDLNHGPEIGDEIRLQGTVGEPQNLTVVSNLTSYVLLSVSNPVPAPVAVTAAAARQERYEGVAVCISNVTVSDEFVSGALWQISDGSSTCEVLHDSNRRLYRYIPQTGNALTALCGVIWQSGTTYRVQVRDDNDFVGRPVVHYALQGLVMTPDGPRTNWYVEIRDDDIVSVGAAAPTVTVYNTAGLIFPGLLDTHNHQGWNSFPTLQFNNAPFGHRDEWAADQEYADWTGRRTTERNHADVLDSTKFTVGKYGELLELMSGCIAIQGMNFNIEFGHPDFGIMNLEEFPARIETEIFPWQMTASERSNMFKRISGGGVQAFLIHLSEGTDEVARAQFDTWYNWGMLTKATTIIHGVPYRTNELDKIAAVGASIVWSPKSNMKLYHGTANIPLYRARGVNVALAPDWTASGSYNLMEEMGYAWRLNQTAFAGALTARDVVDMVTINAARACALESRYGKIAPGYNAGLVVIEDPGGDPYLALVNARPRTVLLTVVDGTPRFGQAALMTSMGFTGETINAWGTAKTLNLVRNHPFLTYETERLSDLTSHLATAHATLTPTGELDREELQYLALSLLQAGPDTVPPFVADAPLALPTNGSVYTIGNLVNLTYRYQDFWDSDTDGTNLVHRQIGLVSAAHPTQVLQVVATDRTNLLANQALSFIVDFRGLHTNYYFRFLTEDLAGTIRTALISSVGFKVNPAANDTDNDDLLDAWEQQIVNANPGDGITNIVNVQPEGDYDNDGYTEEQEQYVGTMPTNAGSYFKVQEVALLPSQDKVVLSWPSASNRTYTLWSLTDLATGARSNLAEGIPATPPVNSYTSGVSPTATGAFYIRVD